MRMHGRETHGTGTRVVIRPMGSEWGRQWGPYLQEVLNLCLLLLLFQCMFGRNEVGTIVSVGCWKSAALRGEERAEVDGMSETSFLRIRKPHLGFNCLHMNDIKWKVMHNGVIVQEWTEWVNSWNTVGRFMSKIFGLQISRQLSDPTPPTLSKNKNKNNCFGMEGI